MLGTKASSRSSPNRESQRGVHAIVVAVPPGHRGDNRTYEALFEGDDFYGPSSDTRPGRGGGADEEGGAEQASRSSTVGIR